MLPFRYQQARGRVPQPSGTPSAHTPAGNKMHNDLHDWFSAPCSGKDSRDEQPWPADHLWQEFTWQQRPLGGQMKPAICQLWICSQPLHEKVKNKREEKKNKTKNKQKNKSQRKDRERTVLTVLQIFIFPYNNRGRQSSMLSTVLACFKPNVIPWRCPALPSAKSSNLISREQHIFMCSSLPEARGLMVAWGS